MRTTIKILIKPTIIIFSAALLISLLIFYLYNLQNAKTNIDFLTVKEKSIKNRCGVVDEKFRFCSYPEIGSHSLIGWDEHEARTGGKSIKLIFNNNLNNYLGIHLHLTLILSQYLKNGVLEFWAKGGKNYSSLKNLEVILKEGPILNRKVKISLPVKLKKDWQKFSFPLCSLQSIDEEGRHIQHQDFTWAIQEVLFSISPSESVELFIDDLKIIDNNRIIYELF